MMQFKPNKTLGLDGFTAEFNKKKCMYKLGPYLQFLFQACIDVEKMPDTWKEARIVMIPKAGKNLTLPQSYCLISLLNVDYKTLTSILAARLNSIFGSFIHADQSGFLKNRNLVDSTRQVQNIINNMNFKKISAVILCRCRKGIRLCRMEFYETDFD